MTYAAVLVCEKCATREERRVETVEDGRIGFKCENCRWWNWAPEHNTDSSPDEAT